MKDLPLSTLKANRSARSRGAVGLNAVVPILVSEMFSKDVVMLDYGSGPDQIHANKLKLDGFKNVHTFDFGQNWREGMQYEVFPNRYDVIYASNVMNTWSTPLMISEALREIYIGLGDIGIFLANYPKSPRYLKDYLDEDMETILNSFFRSVKLLPKNIYFCVK